jgi:hypothetical protein
MVGIPDTPLSSLSPDSCLGGAEVRPGGRSSCACIDVGKRLDIFQGGYLYIGCQASISIQYNETS